MSLEASSDALAEVDLADAAVKLRTKRSRATALEIVTANGQTPLMQLSRMRGVFSKVFRPEAAAAEVAAATTPFVFTAEGDDPIGLLDGVGAPSSEIAPTDTLAEGIDEGEFRFEAAPSPFEVDRAVAAYIPLLEACYALANQQPVAFPQGYVSLGEVRANLAEMAEATEVMPAAVQEAVRNDAEAMEATADPTAFGFVVREERTGAVLVCIRGTQTPREWLANFTAVPNTFSLVPDFGLVHLGFERMYRSVRRSIQQVLAGFGPDVRVTALGHSLGGAMATLAAVDFKRNLGKRQIDLCTIGGPRVGKFAFRRNFNREIPLAFRVTNQFDIVPHVPSLVTGWNHVGEEIEVDGNVDGPHGLPAYLAGLRNIGVIREVSPAGVLPETAAFRGVMSLRVP